MRNITPGRQEFEEQEMKKAEILAEIMHSFTRSGKKIGYRFGDLVTTGVCYVIPWNIRLCPKGKGKRLKISRFS